MKTITMALMLMAAAGCHGQKKTATTTTTTSTKTTTPVAEQTTTTTKDVTGNTQVSPGLSISGDIAAACGIKAMDSGAAPNFNTDEDELMAEDKAVLDQIATCLISGPLKGRNVDLIGRADERGTDEYNMGLGSRRAQSVQGYLTRLGVAQTQLGVTTRGEIDATGTDEVGWAKDRRVDIMLATAAG